MKSLSCAACRDADGRKAQSESRMQHESHMSIDMCMNIIIMKFLPAAFIGFSSFESYSGCRHHSTRRKTLSTVPAVQAEQSAHGSSVRTNMNKHNKKCRKDDAFAVTFRHFTMLDLFRRFLFCRSAGFPDDPEDRRAQPGQQKHDRRDEPGDGVVSQQPARQSRV